VYGLSTQQLDPYGQKPLGAAWLSSTAYLVGEYVQPTAAAATDTSTVHRGRHHQRNRASVALTENATVTDGGVTWKS